MLNFDGTFEVPIDADHGFKVHAVGTGTVENDLFWHGFGMGWEAQTLRAWVGLAKNARVIADIGSNTGVFALSAKAVNSEACVMAFEPAPRIAKILDSNVSLNGYDIEVAKVGLSDRNGTSTFFDSTAEHSYSGSFNPVMMAGRADMSEEIVEVVRFDEFLDEHQIEGVELIKVDVEMHELEVLTGAARCIERDRPIIVIELLTRELAGEVNSKLRRVDYVSFQVDEQDGLFPLEVLTDGRFGDETRDWNFILCPRDKIKTLESFLAAGALLPSEDPD